MAKAKTVVRSSSSSYSPPSSSSPIYLVWEPIVPLGPKAVFHCGCVIRGSLFLHGGITDMKSTQPSNQFYRLDQSSTLWCQIRTPGSPALSHHACVVIDNRFMALIGGWDGRRRTANVHVYDVQEDKWLKMCTTGFPEGAGLSSHTATLLDNRDILIVGREGSLRIQKKYGNAYLLKGEVLSGSFTFKEYSDNVTSRSGHTAAQIGNTLYIIGGRSDKLLEKALHFKGGDQTRCSALTNILNSILKSKTTPLSKLPCGRKNHVIAANQNCILVHGGETFDGRSREPVGEMFLIHLASPTHFYKLNSSVEGRAGHVCCSLTDRLVFHGGYSGKSTINSDLYQLKVLQLQQHVKGNDVQ